MAVSCCHAHTLYMRLTTTSRIVRISDHGSAPVNKKVYTISLSFNSASICSFASLAVSLDGRQSVVECDNTLDP